MRHPNLEFQSFTCPSKGGSKLKFFFFEKQYYFQEFELVQDDEGIIEYATKVVTFSSVHHLSLHFPTNFGEDVTQIYYIGLKGEF